MVGDRMCRALHLELIAQKLPDGLLKKIIVKNKKIKIY